MKKWTQAEAFWHFYCKIAVADFFRGMRAILNDDIKHAEVCLYFADMTDRPFNLEGLDSEQQDRQLAKCL